MRGRHARSGRVLDGIFAGVSATIAMDAAMLAAGRVGGCAFASDRLGPEEIGRWAADLMRGRWRRADITSGPAGRRELWLGLLTHYVTGIGLASAFLMLPRGGAGRPTFRGGLTFGVASSALPLLVLFPSLGYGWFGLRTDEAARIDRIMLIGHTAFGVGLGICARRLASGRTSP